jgi:hypothetical protein
MGINSTATAYNFGQMGSAYLLADDNTVTCPEGMAIVAITFATDSQVKVLVAKDASLYPNTSSAAHTGGAFTRTVNQGTGASTQIIFDEENYISNSNQIEVGDEVYDAAGVLFGTVVALDPDTDNTKEIQISASQTITDDEVLSFRKVDELRGEGTGGLVITAGAAFSAGTTIYGRWDSLQLNDNTSAAIVYFGY